MRWKINGGGEGNNEMEEKAKRMRRANAEGNNGGAQNARFEMAVRGHEYGRMSHVYHFLRRL